MVAFEQVGGLVGDGVGHTGHGGLDEAPVNADDARYIHATAEAAFEGTQRNAFRRLMPNCEVIGPY